MSSRDTHGRKVPTSTSTPTPTRSDIMEKAHLSGRHPGDVEQGGGRAPNSLPRVGTAPARVRSAGESGRRGFHPVRFVMIAFRSASPAQRLVNVLWPVVPCAVVVQYAFQDTHNLLKFILAYLAMVPCANMIGFAGQELARKVPHVFGVLTETTLGSLVEIILFLVLITRPENPNVNYIQVIQSAVLGSVLATMLLCLGLCFVVGGFRRDEQEFSEAVSEVGSGLLLTAGFGLAVPTVFYHSQKGAPELDDRTLHISRSTAILLMLAYLVFVYFQARTHHGIYDAIFRQDEHQLERESPGHIKRQHHRFTMTECIVALAVSITLVTFIAITLIEQIPYMVDERGISDAFVGLILIPTIEKAAEHLTAVDEAYHDQMDFALSHVLGATLQTALFNAPLVVLVGWGLGKPMGLNFEMFDLAVLLLAILTVGNFLRDQKSNYLEGSLCVIVYVTIAVAAYYTPDPRDMEAIAAGETGGAGASG